MDCVKIKKEKALQAIQRNKEEHSKIYLEAIDGYKKGLKEVLLDKLDRLEEGNVVSPRINIERPTHHMQDYDRIIKMLEMSVDNEIELSSREFDQYIMDKWGWQDSFLESNMKFSSRAIGKMSALR